LFPLFEALRWAYRTGAESQSDLDFRWGRCGIDASGFRHGGAFNERVCGLEEKLVASRAGDAQAGKSIITVDRDIWVAVGI
jgi:hypothetical protein